jgi:hypothetical protein
MAEWKPVRELVIVVWREAEAPEEGPETGEEEEGTERTLAFVFNSEQEAIAFIADEVREKVKLNEDNLPPNTVRQIYQALDAGDPIMGLNVWLEAAYTFFQEPEAVDVRKIPLMVKE